MIKSVLFRGEMRNYKYKSPHEHFNEYIETQKLTADDIVSVQLSTYESKFHDRDMSVPEKTPHITILLVHKIKSVSNE